MRYSFGLLNIPAVYMSLSNLLSANVQVGDKVSIVPLIDGKGNLDLPSPKNIRNAGKITVQEEKNAAESTSIQKNSKCLDWLIQYIHELLGGLSNLLVTCPLLISFKS